MCHGPVPRDVAFLHLIYLLIFVSFVPFVVFSTLSYSITGSSAMAAAMRSWGYSKSSSLPLRNLS